MQFFFFRKIFLNKIAERFIFIKKVNLFSNRLSNLHSNKSELENIEKLSDFYILLPATFKNISNINQTLENKLNTTLSFLIPFLLPGTVPSLRTITQTLQNQKGQLCYERLECMGKFFEITEQNILWQYVIFLKSSKLKLASFKKRKLKLILASFKFGMRNLIVYSSESQGKDCQ